MASTMESQRPWPRRSAIWATSGWEIIFTQKTAAMIEAISIGLSPRLSSQTG